MKVLVPIKRVIDYNVKVRVKQDKTGVELANVKMAMNPFDEISVEQAIRLKEQQIADEVIVVSVGPDASQDTIRTALAMGADRGIHIPASHDTEPLAVAKLLQKLVAQEQPQLVLVGKQAIDDDSNQTGQMLSALLGWAQGTFTSAIEMANNALEITREVDGGLEILAMDLPAVLTVDLRLNEPRYASLPNIMKAKKKPIDTIQADDLGVDISQRLKTIQVIEPAVRAAGEIVPDVDSLVDKLVNDAKVIG